MLQSKLGSFYEAIINVIIGFTINFIANFLIMPMFGFHITMSQNLQMGVLYTAISIARSYVIRRWFNQKLQAAAAKLAAM